MLSYMEYLWIATGKEHKNEEIIDIIWCVVSSFVVFVFNFSNKQCYQMAYKTIRRWKQVNRRRSKHTDTKTDLGVI